MEAESKLRAIKVLHTVVWAVFAGSIVAIPVFAALAKLKVAWGLIALVLLEVVVLVTNRMRCPLTDVAGRHTEERQDNFDIYLPLRKRTGGESSPRFRGCAARWCCQPHGRHYSQRVRARGSVPWSLGATAVFKTNVRQFVSLRKVNPPIDPGDLRRIAEFFPKRGSEFQMDPPFEPELEGRDPGMPDRS